jgi:hypothetical protein
MESRRGEGVGGGRRMKSKGWREKDEGRSLEGRGWRVIGRGWGVWSWEGAGILFGV